MEKPNDPLTPHVTFDNYVIPQSVQRETRTQTPVPPQTPLGLPVSGMMWAVSAIALLAFVLGVMGTLKFARPTTQGVAAAGQEEPSVVTRQQGPDLMSGLAAGAGAATPAAAVLTQDGMAEARSTARAVLDPGALEVMRTAVLAGEYKIAKQGLQSAHHLVLSKAEAEETRRTSVELLREAVAEGVIDLPASLHTGKGDSDIDMVLFDLIQSALIDNGTAAGAKAARDMNRRVFAASEAKTDYTKGRRIYVVQEEDSLANLALQFYGHPTLHNRISAANEHLLRSADGIRTGQQLIIPE